MDDLLIAIAIAGGQAPLAAALGVSRQAVHNRVRGRTPPPSLGALRRAAADALAAAQAARAGLDGQPRIAGRWGSPTDVAALDAELARRAELLRVWMEETTP